MRREYFVTLKMKGIAVGYIEDGKIHYVSFPIGAPLSHERFKGLLKEVKKMGFEVKGYSKKVDDTGLIQVYMIYTHIKAPNGKEYCIKSVREINEEDRVFILNELVEYK